MAAEAINELDGPAAAWPYMKPILDRALPAAKVSALQAKYTASKQAFFEGIVDQRAFEFAGEVLRKPAGAMVFDTPKAGETLVIYGLNHGDTDDAGKAMKDAGFEGKAWFLSDGVSRITDDIIQGLYVVDKPSLHCLWPIWTYFINNSNQMLNNEGYCGQLSE